MASILKRPSHRAQLSRYGHDLSRRVTFTSSIGQLLPVLTDYLSPGDKVSLNERLFTRTQPLKTCAFVRVNEHVEYFFVPLCHLDPYWNNAFFGINDFGNSNDVNSPIGGTQYAGKPGTPAAANFASCLASDFMNYLIVNPISPNTSVKVYDLDSSPNAGVVLQALDYNITFDEYGIPRLYNFFRLASMLGYSESLTNTNFFNKASQGEAVLAQNNPRVNLYRFAAYQKIFSDYYRLSDWHSNDVYSYNFGWLNKKDLSDVATYFQSFYYNYSLANSEYYQLFKLRYRPLKKDYFTSVMPSPYFNPRTSPNGYGNGIRNPNYLIGNLQSYILSQFGVQLQQTSDLGTNSPFSALSNSNILYAENSADIAMQNYSDNSYNTIQQHRLMYAYEQMVAITQRAAKHYDDQVLAHFGYKVPQGISNEVYFLGGHTSKLMIGEVVATAAGASGTGNNSSLGEIAGRGVGSSGNNRNITFTAPCHGLLMAIYSAAPEIDYKAMGIEYQNVLNNVNQYPRPEFDNIGMQPLWQFESNLSYLSYFNSSVYIGWQYRYSAFKLAYDSVHGAFNYTLNDWTMSYTFGNAGYSSTPIYDFYCSPTLLDNVFSLSFRPTNFSEKGHSGILLGYSPDAGTPEGAAVTLSTTFNNSVVYERDPLLHTLDISYKKTSWMSTYGLPNL